MRLPLGLLLTSLAALASPAWAQSALNIQPLTIDVVGPSQASSFTLENRGPTQLSLQARIFEWTQVNGEDQLKPTTDVVVSPPAAEIPPGESYTLRVARTAGAVTSGEKSYRLWIDEIPPPIPWRASGGGEVEVRLRYNLPVFFRGAAVKPAVQWRTYRSGPLLVVEAANSGTSHFRVEGLKVEFPEGTVSFGDGLNGYVLAGASRQWTAPVRPGLSATGQAAIVSGVNGRELRQTTSVVSQ